MVSVPRENSRYAGLRREKGKKRIAKKSRIIGAVILFLLSFFTAGGLLYELQTSTLQSRILARLANKCTTRMEAGESPSILFPRTGPYDERLGYVGLPGFIERLTASGFEVAEQARFSPFLLDFTNFGFYPPYREKTQAGLRVTDRRDHLIFSTSYPERNYTDYGAIPEVVVGTLLFMENRELLDSRYPFRNPALEWKRLSEAFLELGYSMIDRGRNVPGGSTLATQMEKFRHSQQGLTGSLRDKLHQMVSASFRAYLEGEETLEGRYRIVLDFINSMPLGAIPGFGEVSGLGDGLYAWYGSDFAVINRVLNARPTGPEDPKMTVWAVALKEVVSLFLAQRRPSYFLMEDRTALEAKTDTYLRLLAGAGIITPGERDAALPVKLHLQKNVEAQDNGSFLDKKAANAIRTSLLAMLGVRQLYQLDRFDLSVKSTLDQSLQQEITTELRRLNDPAYARAAGLMDFRLLQKGDPEKVIYSLTLYERSKGVNLLRLQTDTFDQPLNINSGVKLELGSSAKLRTLVTYLEIMAALHERYGKLTPVQLQQTKVASDDRLSRWALDYLIGTRNRGLADMLAGAMQRRYSADPGEQFFTGGGMHRFSNFDSKDDQGIFSVQEALNHSINLVFIRLMRDIVQYYKYRIPGVGHLLSDVNDPKRQVYLAKFADQEGAFFLHRFYRKYAGKPFEEAFSLLLQGVRADPRRLAAVFLYVRPEAGRKEFEAFLASQVSNFALSDKTLSTLYSEYGSDGFSLLDRGYIAHLHPLELWTVGFLRRHPEAPWNEVLKASTDERQAVYKWLFKTSRKNKQDIRIRTLLEVEAFNEIHTAWKRVKYPFDSLVPSYATAIGSSADRPAALAELVGIILDNGRWYPSIRIEELKFGETTPYETRLTYPEKSGEQVIRPEVAAVVKEAMIGVVGKGTAQRVHKAFLQADGTPIEVGGKTGTGDNRHEIYGSGGRLLQSKVINRTAVFVFFLGERHFGTITAYVAGPEAGGYKFTSALPVQVLKVLAPKLMPLTTKKEGPSPLSPKG